MVTVSSKVPAVGAREWPPLDTRGSKVRKLRQERKWTQTELAVHLGMDRSFLSDLERGKREPCLRTLEVIAQGFELTLPQLFSRM